MTSLIMRCGLLSFLLSPGKTIQSISLLGSLVEENVGLPHLVVAPLSTLRNWEREFATWCPQMNVVCCHGLSLFLNCIISFLFFLHPLTHIVYASLDFQFVIFNQRLGICNVIFNN